MLVTKMCYNKQDVGQRSCYNTFVQKQEVDLQKHVTVK